MVTLGLAPRGHQRVGTGPTPHPHRSTSDPERLKFLPTTHTHTQPEGEPPPATTEQISQQLFLARMWLAHAVTTREAGKTSTGYLLGASSTIRKTADKQ